MGTFITGALILKKYKLCNVTKGIMMRCQMCLGGFKTYNMHVNQLSGLTQQLSFRRMLQTQAGVALYLEKLAQGATGLSKNCLCTLMKKSSWQLFMALKAFVHTRNALTFSCKLTTQQLLLIFISKVAKRVGVIILLVTFGCGQLTEMSI